jgi:hypothetical protein
MKRSARLILLVAMALAVPVAASGATTGSWSAYPGQSTIYQTQVQQPINADGSSVFSNDTKSVIPVKFALLSGLGPFAFESIYKDNTSADDGGGTCGTGSGADHANDCSFLSFTPAAATTFDQITNLVANYTFTLGDCHGGSLRWSVRTSPTQSVFIYYGNPPAFGNSGLQGCTSSANGGVNQSGTNMIGLSDMRYDTSQYVGGTFYDTYAHARTLVGTTPIIRASLVLDSGWQGVAGSGDQRLTLDSATVNDNTFTPAAATPLTKTCKLPPAAIKVTKTSGTPPLGLVNEPISVQPADTNGQFRIVDCKYMYNLAVSSLSGPGTYKVEAVINNQTADGAAYFSLK